MNKFTFNQFEDFAVMDIETDVHRNHKLIIIGYYDGKKYRSFKTYKLFLRHVFKIGYPVFAHYGGGFDYKHMMANIKRDDFKIEFSIQGGRFLFLKLKDKRTGKTVKFYDSYNIFMTSLKKLTFGTSKMEFDVFKEHTYDEWRYYNKIDCIALHEKIKAFKKTIEKLGGPLSFTIASTAMNVFRGRLNRDVYGYHDSDFIRRGYFGGRTEVFKLHGKNLKYYDINSLYPYCMKNFKVPVGGGRETRHIQEHGFYDVLIDIPFVYYPVIPFRHHDKGLIFPITNGSGIRVVVYGAELIKAMEKGAKIRKLYKGVKFDYVDYLFSDYITDFYKLKKVSPRDSSDYLAAKLLMNALYGKFGQREEYRKFFIDPPEKALNKMELYSPNERIFYKVLKRKRDFMIPEIAAAITAYSRLKLYSFFEKVQAKGGYVYYCDTDSIITDVEIETSNELGDMKLEDYIHEGYFLAPKLYAYRKYNGEYVVKAKGFNRNYVLQDYCPNDDIVLKGEASNYICFRSFEEAFAGQWENFRIRTKRINGVLDSIKRYNNYFVNVDMEKCATGAFRKRKRVGIDTMPLSISFG